MISAHLEIDGENHTLEILSIRRIDANRNAITARSRAKLDRGRSCTLRDAAGQILDCVVADAVMVKDIYLLELRCLEGGSFLASYAEEDRSA